MFNIAATLDRARALNGLPSDYKLALVMGVKQTTLTNYRRGNNLPDSRVIRKITDLTGDDPALMAAEIEYIRAKDDDARSIWSDIAERLKMTTKTVQAGFSTLASMGAIIVVCGLLVIAQSHAPQGLQALKEGASRFILCEISSHSQRVNHYPILSRVYRWCSGMVHRVLGGLDHA